MSNHTPGPWTFELNDSIGLWMIGCASDYNFASVYIDANLPDGFQGVPAIAQANARLIAAAPDLLAACEAMLDDHTTNGEAWLMLKAAIAKAKGETQ